VALNSARDPDGGSDADPGRVRNGCGTNLIRVPISRKHPVPPHDYGGAYECGTRKFPYMPEQAPVARSYGARIEDLQALRGRRVSRRVAPLCDGISVDAGACGDGALRNGGRLRLLLTGQGARFSGPGNASYGQGKRGSEKWQPWTQNRACPSSESL